jgi:hypothetical protein
VNGGNPAVALTVNSGVTVQGGNGGKGGGALDNIFSAQPSGIIVNGGNPAVALTELHPVPKTPA